MDLFAPVVAITSASNGGNSAVETLSGTSMATPHVTAFAAAYLQDSPGARPAAVREALLAAATTDVLSGIGAGSPNKLLYSRRPAAAPAQTHGTHPSVSALVGATDRLGTVPSPGQR